MNPKYGWNWVAGSLWSGVDPINFIDFDTSQSSIPSISSTYAYQDFTAVNTASISDANGNLLFYTNGDKIWDINHNVVLDTSNTPAQLYGDPWNYHGITIMPDLYTTDEYWIFYVGPWFYYSLNSIGNNFDREWNNQPGILANQLYYSKVKVTNGVIVPTQLNIPIGTVSSLGTGNFTTGKGYALTLAIVPHKTNTNDFWIVVRPGGTTPTNGPAPWESYLVTNTVSTTPVTSPCSKPFTDYRRLGQIKVNTTYDKIAFAVGSIGVIIPAYTTEVTNNDAVTLYDFDAATGKLTNEQILLTALVEYKVDDVTKNDPPNKYGSISSGTHSSNSNKGIDVLGCEFSNTGKYLYVTIGSFASTYGVSPYQGVLQIDISPTSLATWVVGSANTTVTIPSNQALFYGITDHGSGDDGIGGLQRGPDGYIYFTNYDEIWRIKTLDVALNDSTFLLQQYYYIPPPNNPYLNTFTISRTLPNSPMGLLLEVPPTAEYIKLTSCSGNTSVIIESTDFPPITGYSQYNIYAITGLSNIDVCWTAEKTVDTPTYVGPYTIDEIYVGKASCTQCQDEHGGNNTHYYNLLDCCTGEPYEDDLGNIVYFKYDIPLSPVIGPYPTSYAPPIAIKELKNGAGDTIVSGCLTLNELRNNNIPTTYLNWVDNVATVVSETSCLTCKDCTTCYLLVNCRNSADTVLTTTNLSNYIGQAVSLQGSIYAGKFYFVSGSQPCNYAGAPVSIKDSYQASGNLLACDVANPCYLFTNCSDPSDFFLSDRSEYASFVGLTVTIAELPRKCYKITQGSGCAAPFQNNYTIINGNADCSSCRGCYKLTNCNNSSEVYYYVDSSLSQYVNQYVVLNNRAACFLVTKDTACQGTIGTAPVIAQFTSCSICSYAISGGQPIDPKSLIHSGEYKPKYGKKPKCGVTKPNCNNT